MNWYLAVFKKYAVFNGRARRKEFWMFSLFNFVIQGALTLIDIVIGTYNAESGIGLLSTVYLLPVLIPGIAVSVRRLHDTNRRGWWLLIPFVPLVFMVRDSQSGENQYGPNPKAATA